jgi:hypothetical protein
MQYFGNSLDHTPWYRFPFAEVGSLYASVLWKAASVAAERHGWSRAIMNQGFVTDAIPGVVMGLLGLQLMALAKPLKMVTGEENHTEAEVEELVLAAPAGAEWFSIDGRIRVVASPAPGVYVLTVPSFKPLTEVLAAIARAQPAAVLLQVCVFARDAPQRC